MSVPLSEHLPLIASAPDGIQKLRGLILELAVRGKLLEQCTDQQYKSTNLGLIGKWAVGSGFPTAEQGISGEEILFAKVSDMNLPENKQFITATNNSISRETASRLRVNIHPEGTVIFPKIGGAIATNKRRILMRDTAIDNNCLGLTPNPGVTSSWLFVLLSSINFAEYQAGTSVPALAQGVLAEISVLLPPEGDQDRIVAKVDELMTLCDRLESEQNYSAATHAQLVETLLGTLTQSTDAADFEVNWKRIAEHFDTLFTTEASIDTLQKSIFQLAVTGRLLPLDSIDKQRNWKFGIFSDFFSLEYGDNLPAPKRSGTGEYPVYGSNGVVGTHDECRVTSPCIVVGRKGSAGALNCCREFGCWVTDVSYYCVPPESVDLDFAFILFQTLGLDTLGKGIKPGLSRSEAYLIPVAIPEITEQHLIVAKVNELMAICDSLKYQLAESRQQEFRLADTLILTSLQAA